MNVLGGVAISIVHLMLLGKDLLVVGAGMVCTVYSALNMSILSILLCFIPFYGGK